MRALAGIFGFLVCMLLMTAAYAGSVRGNPFERALAEQDQPRLKMPGEFNYDRSRQTPVWRPATSQYAPAGAAGLSFGPLHAESETINGRRHVHYHVDGLTLMGGDIGGSLSRHGAMLTLHWASSGN